MKIVLAAAAAFLILTTDAGATDDGALDCQAHALSGYLMDGVPEGRRQMITNASTVSQILHDRKLQEKYCLQYASCNGDKISGSSVSVKFSDCLQIVDRMIWQDLQKR